MSEMSIFDPVLFSLAENKFLRDALGKPPIVVASSIPAGINPRAILPVVERVYALDQRQAHSGEGWVGVEALQKAIDVYVEQATRWANDRRRGRVRFPSLASYDSKGRAFRGAPGSDSDRVRTYFNEKGERIRFEVELEPNETPFWVAPTVAEAENKGGIIHDEAKHRLECGVCAHTESYNPEKGRSSYAAARARMSKHLRSAKSETEAHREVYTLEYGSPSA